MGPSSFINTLNELKTFLKFNPLTSINNNIHNIILFHEEVLKDKKQKDFINNSNSIKVYASNKDKISNNYDAFLELPTTLKDINSVIENIFAKKNLAKTLLLK